MIKEIKYITISIGKTIWHDLTASYNDMSRPKEVLNLLFWIAVIQIFTYNLKMLVFTLIAYAIVYIYKIIRHGEWRNIMKQRES